MSLYLVFVSHGGEDEYEQLNRQQLLDPNNADEEEVIGFNHNLFGNHTHREAPQTTQTTQERLTHVTSFHPSSQWVLRSRLQLLQLQLKLLSKRYFGGGLKATPT